MSTHADIRIFVDGDACPVKDEVFRVADRYALQVFVVANAFMRVPRDERIKLIVVDAGPDVADDWIIERIGSSDIVVTADIPLAHRALKRGASVIGTTGRPFTTDSIGAALATRDLMEHLRGTGEILGGGPPPFAKSDRSRFLSALDDAVNRLRRK